MYTFVVKVNYTVQRIHVKVLLRQLKSNLDLNQSKF